MYLFIILGFFRGLAFPLIANGALNSIFFGVYGQTIERMLSFQQNFNESDFKYKRAASARPRTNAVVEMKKVFCT